LPDIRVTKLKGKHDDDKEVPDTNSLIVNIKFMKIKVIVRINLKRPNYNYPSCQLVGRHLKFPVTTTPYIPWMELVFRL